MKAIVCKSWGGPENLQLEEVPSPNAGPGQIKIAVHACGVNFADTLIIQGKYQIRPELPFSPGIEVAGEIMDTGMGVEGFQAGQRVMAIAPYGGYAQEIVVNAGSVLPIPDAMDFTTAAAFPVAYGTAHIALSHRARLSMGETLLVLGAAGGVGLAAVEIGKQLGAGVIAAASSKEKLDLASSRGADNAINYREQDLREEVLELGGADVVFDPVGGEAFESAMRCINWEGRLLVIGFSSGRIAKAHTNLLLVKNCSIIGTFWGAYAQHNPALLNASLLELMAWYTDGRLKPHISHTYKADRARDALRALLDRKSTGKQVVLMR